MKLTFKLEDILVANVMKAGGGCTADEYKAVIKYMQSIQPCKMLVFSVGYDSEMWRLLNDDKVVFLEDSKGWIDKINEEYDIKAKHVTYNTTFIDSMRYIKDPSLMDLKPFNFLKTGNFDFVFIDGPIGYGNGPGRTIPIYISTQLPTVKYILIHDYHSLVEKEAANVFLLQTKQFELVEEVGHLGVFKRAI